MPKGPKLTDKDREMIAVYYNRHKSATAGAIRQIISERLGRELGHSTVQRELARLRKDKTRGSTDPLDDQWSLASLRTYPTKFHDISFLLYIQASFDDNMLDEVKRHSKEKGRKPPVMTNRLAMWLSLLFPLIRDHPEYNSDKHFFNPSPLNPKKLKWSKWVEDLVDIAMWYTTYEVACEQKGIKPIITANFDAPTLIDMKQNILIYQLKSLNKLGISLDDPDLNEKLKQGNITDILP